MSKKKSDTELKQGSKEWIAWRSRGIGASDCPAIMSVSPWNTRFELWAYKSGLLTPPEPHPNAAAAMRRGQELEPVARALYIERTGIQVDPITLTHPTHEFIRASLDGWNEEKKHILELKCPGKADLATARKGQIPSKYKWQLVQQCMIADAASCDYATFDGKDELIIIPFERNKADEEILLAELIAFWELVETKTPPTIDETDVDRAVQRIQTEFEKLTKTMSALFLLNELLLTRKTIE